MPAFRCFPACARFYVIFLCCLGLSGCAATRSNVSTRSVDWLVQQGLAGCDAARMQHLRGAHFTALADVSLRGDLRVVRPGQDLTSDVDVRRLNVQVDAQGQMLRLFCG
jgi:hypothetical protein